MSDHQKRWMQEAQTTEGGKTAPLTPGTPASTWDRIRPRVFPNAPWFPFFLVQDGQMAQSALRAAPKGRRGPFWKASQAPCTGGETRHPPLGLRVEQDGQAGLCTPGLFCSGDPRAVTLR